MDREKKRKILFDAALFTVSCLWLATALFSQLPPVVVKASVIISLVLAGFSAVDWIRQRESGQEPELSLTEAAVTARGHELILLNEEERPVKSWDLTGKTAVVIGRRNKDEDVDIDLSDCEYSALINIQHGVLNYCLDCWYLEDLNSKNGIRIRKVEDGICYQVTQSRPCKISSGDVIYIARTKLLFT